MLIIRRNICCIYVQYQQYLNMTTCLPEYQCTGNIAILTKMSSLASLAPRKIVEMITCSASGEEISWEWRYFCFSDIVVGQKKRGHHNAPCITPGSAALSPSLTHTPVTAYTHSGSRQSYSLAATSQTGDKRCHSPREPWTEDNRYSVCDRTLSTRSFEVRYVRII